MIALFLLAILVSDVFAIKYSVILTADDGTFSGVAENRFIVEEMSTKTDISNLVPYCLNGLQGVLKYQDVLVITTGIGHDHATQCTLNVLNAFPQQVKEVFFLGTSGWSVKPGGLLTPPNKCNPTAGDVTLLGDVCVSSSSTNFDCHFSNWNTSLPQDVCYRPQWAGHDRYDIFGNCSFRGDGALADELLNASSTAGFPFMNSSLRGLIDTYWALNSRLTSIHYKPRQLPRVLGNKECAEASTYNLWSGVPNDILCREYMADLGVDPEKAVCVSAMEAIGYMTVLLNPASFVDGKHIPFATIRGASDYAHSVIEMKSTGWAEYFWMNPDQEADFMKQGYGYAILTASEVLLSLFNKRIQS